MRADDFLTFYEVFDPHHARKSVFFAHESEAVAYARAVRRDLGPPVRKGAGIVRHMIATTDDLVNMLNGYYECHPGSLEDLAAAAE